MLLKTKFLAPAYNPKSVDRQRLLDRLVSRSTRKLLLVSAPAGYGKTTLVLQWLQRTEVKTCWLSLDEHDNQSARFWKYFIGAIQTQLEGFGAEAEDLIESAPNIEAAITSIINELITYTENGSTLSLVLDDFHNITDPDTLRAFAYLVDFLPPGIELILTTRFEPSLPISRWSVKNWVDAVYANDLVFNLDEAKLFFSDYMNISLSDQQVSDIYQKTEGWIAAMQLTALTASTKTSTQHGALNANQLLAEDRHFSDYVITEILEHQDKDLSRFLLETSCLLRLSAELCDSATQRNDSREMLRELEQRNLFLIPLDRNGEWYRYHEMMRDSVLKNFRKTSPESLIEVQQRAVNWLLDNGQAQEAIAQVVQLKDWPLLAQLLENNGNNLIHEGNHLPMLEWLHMLPESLKSQSARLQMLHIWALFFSNKIEVIPPLLDDLENLVDTQRIENIQTSADELIDLHSEISLIRSYLARTQSDLRSAKRLTKQVLEELDNTNMPLKSVTYYGLGLDSFTIGDLDSAETALLAAIKHGKKEKKYTTVLSSSGLLGWIYFYQGKLEIALETGISNQQWIDSYHDPSQPRIISCWQNSILAMIYLERGDTTVAASYINPLLKHITLGTEPGLHVLIQYTQANVLFAQGQLVEAIERLDDAISVYEHKKDSIIFTPPSLRALKSRCLMAMDNTHGASVVLDSIDSDTINELPLNFEDINLCKARVFLKQRKTPLALEICDRIATQALEENHIYHLIQALHLKALCYFKSKREAEASACIAEALLYAGKENFVRVFLQEDNDTTQVLALAKSADIPDAFLKALSQGLGVQQPSQQGAQLPGAAALEGNLKLLEPLSQRELEVLALIDQGLANKEIAQKLSLAPATVKAHIRNIYGKINAKSRTEALSKARQLALI